MYKVDTNEQVFFYEQEFYVLSNFSSFTLQWEGHRFDTSEAAYHWEKFNYNNYFDIQEEIRLAISAHEAFKVAEKYHHFVLPNWADKRVGIMREILYAKAQQHEYVRRKLLETGDRELIEDSWRDSYWGWGADQKGANMLGKLWMEIRTQLQNDAAAFKANLHVIEVPDVD